MKYLLVLCIINLLSFLFFNYYNLVFNKNIKFNKIYIVLLILSALFIAYATLPSELDDLYRYFDHINMVSAQGIAYLKIYPYKFNYIISFLFLLISLIGNVHILPVVVISIYIIAVKLLIKKGNFKDNTTLLSLAIIVMFSFEYFNTLISSVRFPLATAVFILILINDNKDWKYNFLYVLPILIHSSYILLIGLVFLVKLVSKYNKDITKFLVILPYVLVGVSIVFPENVPFFSEIFNKLKIYIDPRFSLQYIDYRVLICNIVLFIVMVYSFKIDNTQEKLDTGEFYVEFYKNLKCLLIGFLPLFSIFSRFISVFLLLTIPFMTKINITDSRKKKIILSIVIISMGVLCYRGVNAIHYWNFIYFN